MKKTTLCFLPLLLVFLHVLGATQSVQKSLKRVDDPIVITGKELATMLGSTIDRLSLMACNGDAFGPVPFQVDEKNPDGDYVYKQGPGAGEDKDPLFDGNDELVFMADSIGDRCNDLPWPGGAEAGSEITVTDPVDNGKGWVYLFRFKDKPALSKSDRVSIDFSNNRTTIKTPEYVWAYPSENGFPDELRVPDAKGVMGPDILDRFKTRGKIILPGGVIRFEMKVDDIIYHDPIGWIDGPVRVILCSKAHLKIGFYKYNLPINLMQFYYPNTLIFPVSFTMEKSAVKDFVSSVTDIRFDDFMDYNEKSFGIYTYDAFNPFNKELVFDGKMSEAEKSLKTEQDRDWVVAYRPGVGGWVNRIIFPEEWAGVARELYYNDDRSIADPPEDYPGIFGHGYKFKVDLKTLKPGQYTHYQRLYFKRGLTPGGEKIILDILNHPLEVKAGGLNPER